MRTAREILQETHPYVLFCDDPLVNVELIVQAMEEYAAQFSPAETQTHTDGIRVLPDEKLLKDPKTFFDTYGKIEPPKT